MARINSNQVPTLISFLTAHGATHEDGPSGQHLCRFSCGFIVAVYETGSIVFQGTQSPALSEKINSFMSQL
ncbi:TPA: hypothetical protein SLN72_003152 [Morganella morganii]|uniref:hypothetical protein n=1 Tax=Enterobacterales TaxID=91347 RepID=UPI001A210E00|nr:MULTISPECIES: hypothetical protein [Enterobacterales]MCU6210991.1 hypothetical protein [Morganella morganii]HAT1513936.1 hypothetical protein [Morganella morganii]HEI9846153.1 hypothetical protein [Morganella morganii]